MGQKCQTDKTCEPEPFLFETCDDSLPQTAAESNKRSVTGRDAGSSPDTVKHSVTTLKHTSVQRQLRDPNRNRSFPKVTLDNRDGKELILCESDDLVFEFDCNATSGCGVRCWFVLSKKPKWCWRRRMLDCTTCTSGSNSAKRNTRRHAHVHERSYPFAIADPVLPGLTFCIQL